MHTLLLSIYNIPLERLFKHFKCREIELLIQFGEGGVYIHTSMKHMQDVS